MKNRFFRRAIQGTLAGVIAFTIAGASEAQQWVSRHGMTSAQYQSWFDTYKGQGYRLTDVDAYSVNGKGYYAAIWSKSGGGAWVARHGLQAPAYQQTFDNLTAKGYAPMFIDAMSRGSGLFAGFWQKTGGAWVARHGMSGQSYQQEFNAWVGKGYRLVDVSGYAVSGQARYAAIWKKQGGSAWQARHGMTSASYQQTFDAMKAQGYRPVHVDGYTVNGTPYFAAIWDKGRGSWVARHNMSSSQYQSEFDKWVAQGYRLVDVSGYESGGKARYAAIWHR
ncbi:hypothetical protein KUV73_00435 [Mameliella alba]|nr:hypothetical protein [Mameliella alba]MBY6167780.1 hypothetical protein [Mameliella alba]MBY6172801.1 hypothetical protein [Mameliella alba]